MDDGLDVNEIKLLMDLVNDAQKIKRGKSEPKLIRKIVPVEQWLEDEYYIGKSGMYLYPYWKKEIIDVFGTNRGKYNEIIVNGGIG